ncbi:MAG: hypothetical protein FWG31_05380 [Oscillospiraceae bacterium]|nr:hypothetical protein [Oscillospiraceae bacterium]
MLRSVKTVLRKKTGASMLFVLAAMFLLTAIGASALAAAGTNRGANAEKRRENQLRLYVTGMEQTLRTALDATPTSLASPELTSQILNETYRLVKSQEDQEPGAYKGINSIQFPSGSNNFRLIPDIPWNDVTFVIDVHVDMRQLHHTRFKGYVAPQEDYDRPQYNNPDDPDEITGYDKTDAIPRVPEEIHISTGTIIFDVEATLAAVGRMNAITVKTRTTYRYNGGTIMDTQGSASIDDPTMEILESRRWTFVSHERIDY